MKGVIFDVKEMALHDGPGIRTTVFLKGCPLRCKWCHNPEGFVKDAQLSVSTAGCTKCNLCKTPCDHIECQPFKRCLKACPRGLLSICGEEIESDELVKRISKGAKTLGSAFGGFTFSGGEPLMQADFLIDVSSKLQDYHLAIETSGYADNDVFLSVIQKMDLVIMDIKLADATLHKAYTGSDNSKILENLKILKDSGKAHVIRTPLIPGITDTKENLRAIETLVGNSKWEHLPYNTLAGAKYKNFGLNYEL